MNFSHHIMHSVTIYEITFCPFEFSQSEVQFSLYAGSTYSSTATQLKLKQPLSSEVIEQLVAAAVGVGLLLGGGDCVVVARGAARGLEGLVDDVLPPQHIGQELWRDDNRLKTLGNSHLILMVTVNIQYGGDRGHTISSNEEFPNNGLATHKRMRGSTTLITVTRNDLLDLSRRRLLASKREPRPRSLRL